MPRGPGKARAIGEGQAAVTHDALKTGTWGSRAAAPTRSNRGCLSLNVGTLTTAPGSRLGPHWVFFRDDPFPHPHQTSLGV